MFYGWGRREFAERAPLQQGYHHLAMRSLSQGLVGCRPDQCLQSIDELGIDPGVRVSVVMENYVHLLLLPPPFCQRKTFEYKIHEQPLLVVLTSLAWRAFAQDSWQHCLLSCWQSLLIGFFNPDNEIRDTNISSKHVQILMISKQ